MTIELTRVNRVDVKVANSIIEMTVINLELSVSDVAFCAERTSNGNNSHFQVKANDFKTIALNAKYLHFVVRNHSSQHGNEQ